MNEMQQDEVQQNEIQLTAEEIAALEETLKRPCDPDNYWLSRTQEICRGLLQQQKDISKATAEVQS